MKFAGTGSTSNRGPDILNWVQIIRAEYLESPGLYLTKGQAQKLWGIDALTCETVLSMLVAERFLTRTRNDQYARVQPDR